MKRFQKYLPFIVLALILVISIDADAQCAMCKANAETTHAEGNRDVAGLNLGILYLFFAPFAIIGFIYYMWRKNRV